MIFGGFLGAFLSNNSIRCNPLPILEVLFGVKTSLLGHCLPYYLLIAFRLPSYTCVFLEAFTVVGSHTTLQMAIRFSCPSRIPSLTTFFPLPPPIPVPPSTSIHSYLVYFPFLGESFPPCYSPTL